MSRRNRTAADLLAATFLLIAALAGSIAPAAAQSADPFALPGNVTIADAVDLSGPGLSTIRIDGKDQENLVRLAWIDGTLHIDADDARTVGLPVSEDTNDTETGGYVPLDNFILAKWDFSQLDQTLIVKKFRKSDGVNYKDMGRPMRDPAEFRPMAAFLMDYDLTASAGASGSYAAGSFDARLARGDERLGTNFRVLSDPATGYNTVTRLNTALQMADRARGVTITVGDHITVGSNSQRPLRFGGIQIASDFALRPGIVSYPLPAFDGQVAVPTGIDLIINDKRFSAGELEAGEFAVRNVPVSPGRGEVSVVLRDELGREVVQTTKLYVSRELLRKGLWDGGVNIGTIRRNFGKRNADYRDLAATFLARRGLSDTLSLGASGELGAGIANLGAHGEVALGGVALATAEVRGSTGGGSSGALVRMGVESFGRGLSGRIEGVFPTKDYRDLAAASGDALPVSQINAMVNFDLRQYDARFLVSASRITRQKDPRYPTQTGSTTILRANARKSLADRLDVGLDLAWRKSDNSRISAMIGVMYRFGERTQAMGNVSRNGSRTSMQASLQRPDVQPGDYGYAVEATHAITDRLSGRGSYRTPNTRAEMQAEYVSGRIAARTGVRGTLIATGGTVFARNQTGGAYAFVQTGNVGGVTVMRENRLAGVSDEQGRVLVEQVTPLVPTQFDIDPDELPADVITGSTYRRVAVARGSVGRVEMDISAFRSLPVRVIDTNGKPLPLGMMLQSGRGESYMVGYDGLIDYNALSPAKTLRGEVRQGQACTITVPDGIAAIQGMAEIRAECSQTVIALAD